MYVSGSTLRAWFSTYFWLFYSKVDFSYHTVICYDTHDFCRSFAISPYIGGFNVLSLFSQFFLVVFLFQWFRRIYWNEVIRKILKSSRREVATLKNHQLWHKVNITVTLYLVSNCLVSNCYRKIATPKSAAQHHLYFFLFFFLLIFFFLFPFFIFFFLMLTNQQKRVIRSFSSLFGNGKWSQSAVYLILRTE